MNYWVSLYIGAVIFLVSLFNEKWAAALTLAGFIPFCLMAVTGVIGPASELVGQRTLMGFDEIMATYVAGIAFGWIPRLLFSKNTSVSK